MNRLNYYRNKSPTLMEIDRPRASKSAYSSISPGKLDAAAAWFGWRKTRKMHKIACPVPTRRHMAAMRKAALRPGRNPQRGDIVVAAALTILAIVVVMTLAVNVFAWRECRAAGHSVTYCIPPVGIL